MKKCDWLGTHVTWPTQVWHFCTMNKRLFEISRTPTREILKYTIYTCLVTQHDEYDVCTIFVLRRDTVIKGVMSVCVIDRAVYNLIGKVWRCYTLYVFLCDVIMLCNIATELDIWIYCCTQWGKFPLESQWWKGIKLTLYIPGTDCIKWLHCWHVASKCTINEYSLYIKPLG